MGKFYYTTGVKQVISGFNAFGEQVRASYTSEDVRSYIHPEYKTTINLFETKEEADAFSRSQREIHAIYKTYPLKQPAVFYVYVLEMPSDARQDSISLATNQNQPWEKKSIAYTEIKNDPANVLAFSASLDYVGNFEFIPTAKYQAIFSRKTDIMEATRELFKDYAAPYFGFIPKEFANYHHTGIAQEIDKALEGKSPQQALDILLETLTSKQKEVNFNTVGSFLTTLVFAIQKLSDDLHPQVAPTAQNLHTQTL